ncbi:MAG: hypothetical protein DMG07_25445, partial [Acidobacteria bacterium]
MFVPARRVTPGPVLSPDRPYEGHAVIATAPPVYDAATRRYELTYGHVPYGSISYEMRALSGDLEHWTKPDLGRVEIDGSRSNNALRRIDHTRASSVIEDFAGVWEYAERGLPDLRSARFWMQGRPVLVVRGADGRRYLTSADPALFLREGGTETMCASGDTVAAFGFDPRTGEYVVYTSPGPPNAGRGSVRYDNSTKARTLARHATRDGVNWEARYVWVPEVDAPNLHNYGFRVKAVGELYLGFFPRYNVRSQHMDLQLWTSRDGIHWDRPGGKAAWLANGPEGSFDWGISYMPMLDWHEQGERTRMFFHGANYLHFHAWVRERLGAGVR